MKKPVSTSVVSLYSILAVNFVGTLGFSIVMPFLIFLVIKFGGNAFIYGILSATYSAFQLVGAPLLGKWSDMYGRKKILFLSQIGTLISWLVFLAAMYLPTHPIMDINSEVLGTFSLTVPLIILFSARALDGITGGNVSVANAYLADITDDEKRSENFGKMSVSTNLGYIIGPALAGLLGATSLGETMPVLAAILISVMATIIIAYSLHETNIKSFETDPEKANVRKFLGQEQKECYKIDCKYKITLLDLLKLDNVFYLLTIYFLIFLGFNFFYIAFPVYAVEKLGWELSDTGFFFAFLSLAMVIVQGPVLSRAAKIFSDGLLIFAGNFFLAVSFLFYMAESFWLIYLGSLLLALGNGLMWPSLLSILSKVTDSNYQGRIQGIASSCGSLASIIGLLAGGVFFEQLGSNIFLLTSLVIFIVFLMSAKLISLKSALVQK